MKQKAHISLDDGVFARLDAMAAAEKLDRSGMIAALVEREHERRAAMRRLDEAPPLSPERVAEIRFSLPQGTDATPLRRAARLLYPKAERIVTRQRREQERDVEISIGLHGGEDTGDQLVSSFATERRIRRLAEEMEAT